MTEITLFASPGACSLVSMMCLQAAQADYSVSPVILSQGMHKHPEYLAINPKGKVPALRVGDRIITETPAIVLALDEMFPQAGLLPRHGDDNEVRSDLCFIASGVHPLVTRYCKPDLIGDCTGSIREKAAVELQQIFRQVNGRLVHSGWWYKGQWSALDAYWFWVTQRLSRCQFDFSAYPALQSHEKAMIKLTAVQEALLKDQAMLTG